MKPVATGNWGCGVFGGDLHLKSNFYNLSANVCHNSTFNQLNAYLGLIQLMAASARKRPLCYFTFGNRKFAEDFTEIYRVLVQVGTTVGTFNFHGKLLILIH